VILNALNALAITVSFLCLVFMFWGNICYFFLVLLFSVFLINGMSYIYNLADFHHLTLAISFGVIALNKSTWFSG